MCYVGNTDSTDEEEFDMSSTKTVEEVVERVRDLRPEQLAAVLASLDAVEGMDVVLAARGEETLPGLPDVGPDELRAAAARNEARVWQARAALYETGLSRDEAAARVGVQPNQVTNLLSAGRLLALDGPDGLRLPAWQFHPESRRGRLDGIERVAAVFPGRVLGLSTWMTTANPALGGRTPREALLEGDVEQVVAIAEHVGA
jgi:hypothetical protein